MKRGLLIALMCVGTGAAAIAQDDLVVHEWGTFTTIAGEDGIALEWRPFAATNDLPGFVYNPAWLPYGIRSYVPKGEMTGTVRMETPVLYFYASRETNVAVKVLFPGGRITEWYPQARSVGEGIDWGCSRLCPVQIRFSRTTGRLITIMPLVKPMPPRFGFAARKAWSLRNSCFTGAWGISGCR
jgi:hypothetical protein